MLHVLHVLQALQALQALHGAPGNISASALHRPLFIPIPFLAGCSSGSFSSSRARANASGHFARVRSAFFVARAEADA
ncbi:hypothetical protein WS73_07515 [Burkholderia savannae]|nr:hypothetical protein WS73_07515 [Burkholderia savannae]